MFRVTDDPSSGKLAQCLAKNYKNDSVVSVDMNKFGVMAAYSGPLCVCVCSSLYMSDTVNYTHTRTHAQRVTICCHNTDLVHVNGYNRIILATFCQALCKAP